MKTTNRAQTSVTGQKRSNISSELQKTTPPAGQKIAPSQPDGGKTSNAPAFATGFDAQRGQKAALDLISGGSKAPRQALSKAASASVAGLEIADSKTPSSGRLKKGFLALMTGLMAFNSVSVASAQDLSLALQQPTTPQHELVVGQSDFGLGSATISPWQTRLGGLDGALASKTAEHSPAVKQAIDNAFSKFETRIQDALTPGGLDLARTATGGEAGFNLYTGQGQLSDAQERAVKSALTGLFKDLPVAAYSDGMASSLTSFFTARGVAAKDLQAATLSDFGSAGGEVAKEMVDNFRENKPGVFYSLATVLAGGAAAASYFQGSDVLESIGLKPEISTRILDNTKLSLGASWDEKFTNPTLELGARNVVDFNNAYRLTTDATAYLSGSSFSNLGVDAWKLSTTFHADDNHTGVQVYASDAVQAMHGLQSGMQVGTSAWYTSDSLRVSGGLDYNLDSDQFNARISADYSPRENLSIGVYGTHSSSGDSVIGVGASLRF